MAGAFLLLLELPASAGEDFIRGFPGSPRQRQVWLCPGLRIEEGLGALRENGCGLCMGRELLGRQ